MRFTTENITKRKDGRFMGRFIIGYGDSGKVQYQYVYGKTYDEAEEKLLIGKEIESKFISGRNILVKKVYAEWISAVANRVKESTLANYKLKFEKHILPEFGDMPCSRLSVSSVNAFISKKLSEGKSAGYIRDIIIVFKMLLKYAQEEHGLKISLKNIMLPRCERKAVKKLSETEQKMLVSYLKRNINPTSLGVLISLLMGLRIGELCGLRWNDVDLENKLLCINRTVQRIASTESVTKTKIVISSPKSATSRRCISIPDCLIAYFEGLKKDGRFYILSGTEDVIEPRTMQYRYKSILRSALISNHSYHQLRHTFATNCILNGFDIKTLSNILGHSSVSLTLSRYIHPDTAHERLLMNNMCLLF